MALQQLSEQDLGKAIREAVQKAVNEEVEAEITGAQERVAERIRERLGAIASRVTQSRQFGMPEINISITIGETKEL